MSGRDGMSLIERVALAIAGEDEWPPGTSDLTRAKYYDAARRVMDALDPANHPGAVAALAELVATCDALGLPHGTNAEDARLRDALNKARAIGGQ